MAGRAFLLLICMTMAAGCASIDAGVLKPVAEQTLAAQASPSSAPPLSPVPSGVGTKTVPAKPGTGPVCTNFRLTAFTLRQDREGYVLASWSSRGGCPPFSGWLSGTTSFNTSGPPNVFAPITSSPGSVEVSITVQMGFCPHMQMVTVTLALMIQDRIGAIVQPPLTKQISAQC